MKRSGRASGVRPSLSSTAGSPIYRSIWGVVARIPRGRVATYGQIAALSGHPGQARLVGYALRNLPAGSGAPWHRVINREGRISARAGALFGGEESLQARMLRAEGILFDGTGRLDLARYQWRPRSSPPRSGRSSSS